MRYPIPRQFEIPEVVSGYELDPAAGWFWVVIPEASTNLCINPSFETNTTGWAGLSAAISRVSTYQRYGTYALKVQPTAAVNDGCYLGNSAATLIPTTAGQWYTASFYIRGAGGLPYKCYWADQWGNRLGQEKTFAMPHDWGRITISWYENQTTARRLYITKTNVTNIQPFYIDGVLIENKAYATTYFDGDSVGYITGVSDFYWTGARHASTSVRSAQTLAGGRPVRLKDLGFTLLAIIGLGMAQMQPISQDYGWQDGGLYQRTRKPPRDFTLAGYVSGATDPERKRNRAQIEAALSPDNVATQQPLTLLYEYTDECGGSFGEVLSIPCVYRGGMEGKTDNLYSEKVALSFTMFMPFIQSETQEGATLTYQASVLNANMILQRSPAGVWSSLGSGAAGGIGATVEDILVGPDGSIYVCGTFTSMGGVANTAGIAKWSNGVWSALGTGPSGISTSVHTIAFGPDGTLYAGGTFDLMGGVAGTKSIAKWNGTIWSAMTTGTAAAGIVYSIVVGQDGTIYAGGFFANMSGVANTLNIAKWNGAAWAAMGTGATGGSVYGMTIALDGAVYAGGSFTGMGGVANTNRIAKWNGTAWGSVGGGVGTGSEIFTLETGPDGTIYAGGVFTVIGGVIVSCIAKWNGSAWSSLGSGVTLTGGGESVFSLSFVGTMLYVGGSFDTANGIPFSQSAVMWNGSTFVSIDVFIPGAPPYSIRQAMQKNDGIFYIGFTNTGIATTGAPTAITPTITEMVFPVITFTGPGSVYSLRNENTGDALYFNLTLQAGEVATLNLTPGNISFTSTFRGNILSTILPGSNLASFKLLPGANIISVFVAGTTSAATAVDMRWTPQYLGLEH